MSYVLNILAVIVAFSLLSAGCSKKSSKGTRAAKPAASSTPAGSEAPQIDPPNEEELNGPAGTHEKVPTPPERPSRFSEQERSRFDNSRYNEVPNAPDVEVADAPGDPDLQSEAPADTGETGGVARNKECGTAYRRNTEQWAPGLPYPPAQTKICTGGTVKKMDEREQFTCENNPDLVFTDSRQDGLMALAVERANRAPRHMDQGSRELARRIRDVRIAFARNSTEVRTKIKLLVGENQHEDFEFRGAMKNSNGGEGGIRMIPVSSARGLKFNAVMTCADEDGSCGNAILRLQQLTRSGKVGRVVYIVIRAGEAHVTISEQDRIGFRSKENKEHGQFAEFLSNTTYNSCVSVLRQATNGVRQLPTCAYQRLRALCGRKSQFKSPAAQTFEIQTWAVAYGPSGFEFEMIDGDVARFSVKGPLVAGSATPIWPRALDVKGAFAIERAILVANDGGGNLNLQVDFKGGGNSRISVTNLMEDVRYSSQAVINRARQMPELGGGEIAGDEELRDDEREDRGEPRRHVAPNRRPAPVRRELAPARAAPAVNASADKAAKDKRATNKPPGSVPAVSGAANKPKPPALVPMPDKATQDKKTAPGKSAPAPKGSKPAAGTRPLPANPNAAAAAPVKPTNPAPASGPRFEAQPANTSGGVPAREKEDNLVVQPRDVEAPKTPAPGDSNPTE